MKAFHNDAEIKKTYLARVIAHRKADEITKGTYWVGGKGCAVGCTIHSSAHGAYEAELGIPRILARLEDIIFEGLSNEEAQLWPEEFLDSVQVGADLSKVWPQFVVWLLTDPKHGVIQFATGDRSRGAFQAVSSEYTRLLSGDFISPQYWVGLGEAAKSAAYGAASAAAYGAAAYDAAAYGAASAAYACAYAYAYAYAYADAYAYAYAYADAYDDAAAAAAAAARRNSYSNQAAKLLQLLRAAK